MLSYLGHKNLFPFAEKHNWLVECSPIDLCSISDFGIWEFGLTRCIIITNRNALQNGVNRTKITILLVLCRISSSSLSWGNCFFLTSENSHFTHNLSLTHMPQFGTYVGLKLKSTLPSMKTTYSWFHRSVCSLESPDLLSLPNSFLFSDDARRNLWCI